MKTDLMAFPATSNLDLSGINRPKKLTLAEFESLPVRGQDLKRRKEIYQIEEYMHSIPGTVDDKHMHEMDMEPVHRFVAGLYHRELTIPPNTVVVGKRHAIEHIVMLTVGECLCFTERGMEEMKAPMTFISPAGEKRIVVTRDKSCTWVTLHPTDKTDLKDVEDEVIIAEPERAAHYEKLRASVKEIA